MDSNSRTTRRTFLSVAAAVGVAATATPTMAQAGKAATPADRAKNRHALLVGCTTYDNLEKKTHLVGPANDVKLFRDLLVGRFGFQNIVTLAESEKKAELRPTKANIKHQFEHLISVANPDAEIVILLGGHGTQQPNADPETDSEPDGLDEVFLPADIASWSSTEKSIVNAVTDDEIRKWLDAMRDKGASVWIIIDACHSGTMVRGLEDERVRQITPETLIPKEVLASVKSDKSRGSGPVAETAGGLVDSSPSPHRGKLVALYAAQSIEPTVELPLPYEAMPDKRVPHGLLTFTINQILTQAASPLTYGELMQRVQQQYTAWGRQYPTPLAEGDGLAQEVMGYKEWPGRSQMTLRKVDGELMVNAGLLHGIANGTILAVYPPPGSKQPNDKAGCVKVTDSSTLQSYVTPCDQKGQPTKTPLPENGRLEVEAIDYSSLRSLKVGVETIGQPSAAKQLIAEIQSLGGFPQGLIEFQEDLHGTDWIVRTLSDNAYLVPASGWAVARGLYGEDRDVGSPGPEYGPFNVGSTSLRQLAENLGRIARVQSLLKLAPALQDDKAAASGIQVKLAVHRHMGRGDTKGEPIDFSKGAPTLKAGEMIGFHIVNEGREAVDVTLLFIDAGYGITAWYPKPGTSTDNRIEPRSPKNKLGPPDVPRSIITADTTGIEHIVLIAVKAEGAPLDFTWLAQPGIAAARGIRGTKADTPLTKLFEYAAYRGTRGEPISAEGGTSPYLMRTISWKVPPN